VVKGANEWLEKEVIDEVEAVDVGPLTIEYFTYNLCPSLFGGRGSYATRSPGGWDCKRRRAGPCSTLPLVMIDIIVRPVVIMAYWLLFLWERPNGEAVRCRCGGCGLDLGSSCMCDRSLRGNSWKRNTTEWKMMRCSVQDGRGRFVISGSSGRRK